MLHGGRADSHAPVTERQLAVLRMRLLAGAVHAALAERGVDVFSLRFAVRGWNGAQESPVADARWALEEVRHRTGGRPVVLIGHSMGGRTALRVADDASVREVVALAPWLEPGEPVRQLRGRRLLIAHGTADRVTSPEQSRRYARRAEQVAADVELVEIRGETHAMLRAVRTWNRIAVRGVLDGLGVR